MWRYGIDENGQPAIEYVPPLKSSKTPWIIIGGTAGTEERAKLLLNKMMKKREVKCST